MKMTVSWFSVPSATAGEKFDLDCLDSGAKRELSAGLAPYAGMTVRVRVTKSQPRKTDEEKEAKTQAKADKKAAKAAAKSEKEAAKTTKKASNKTEPESVPAPNIKKAAEKAINAPTKKSHHNPAKGY